MKLPLAFAWTVSLCVFLALVYSEGIRGGNRAHAQVVAARPADLDGVDIEEHLDHELPLGLTFRDDRGREATLEKYFSTGRPVILTLNYAECPLLCQLQLQGLVDSLRDLQWDVGDKFDVLTVSIDPTETWQQAALAKQRYVKSYGRAGTAGGWHFLTGTSSQIEALADAVGFRYRYLEDRGEYAHTAALIICTPDGKVSRYLYGIEYPQQTLRLSLVEAAEGKIGSTLDRVLLFCFHYDAESGRYGPSARRLMQVSGLATVLMLLGGLVPYWLLRRDRNVGLIQEGQGSVVSPRPLRSSFSQG